MHQTRHHIGVVLERICSQARLTAEAVADRTGSTSRDVADFLSGKKFPSAIFILRFAQISGTDPQLLFKVWEDERERRAPRPARAGQDR
ncbi:helix-turn-helix domain-containing protein [Streptomyces sp. NBC_01525]|uniref:helix-turn-helix domain-containing protein n=1 Tax=Streptomyces sp. NBC_01525 TaxID=2903893 RepID=UPI003865FDEC